MSSHLSQIAAAERAIHNWYLESKTYYKPDSWKSSRDGTFVAEVYRSKNNKMEKATHLDKSVFAFLKELEKNNNRDWFAEHKGAYTNALEQFKAFAETVKAGMEKQDHIEKMKLYRIYRDVRFSKNKTPYKTSFSGGFTRATKALRGGYYLHLQPGHKSMVGGGFWQPEAPDLKRIREEIAADASPMRKIINSPNFKKHFGSLEGQQLKTAPTGFPKDHPDIDLLRYKSFTVSKHFTDKEVTTPGFSEEVLNYFKAMRPFFDYMSEVLTTDSNGVSLIDWYAICSSGMNPRRRLSLS